MDPLIKLNDEFKIRSMRRLHYMAKIAIKEEFITHWFSQPHPLLQMKTPFEACFTDEGYDQVEEILASIIYGFPS